MFWEKLSQWSELKSALTEGLAGSCSQTLIICLGLVSLSSLIGSNSPLGGDQLISLRSSFQDIQTEVRVNHHLLAQGILMPHAAVDILVLEHSSDN